MNTTDFMVTVLDNNTLEGIFYRYSWTQFLEIQNPFALTIDRCITPVWYVIGVAGNVISAKIWMEKRMRSNNSSATYLVTLSITDMIFLMLHMLQELKYAWNVRTLNFPFVCESYFVVYLAAQYLSPLLVLGFTTERYIAVCHPFKKEKYCTPAKAIRVVLSLVAISLALCLVQAYFWTFHESECQIRATATTGGDASFWSIYTWVSETLIFVIVPLTMLVFNILVIREVRRMDESHKLNLPGQTQHAQTGAATTVMILSVSFYVIFTTLPATVVYSIVFIFPEGNHYLTNEQISVDPVWQKYLTYISVRKFVEEVCLSHYACNFFIYLCTGALFRKSLVDTFKCLLYKRLKGTDYLEVSRRGSHSQWQSNTTKV